MKSIKHPLILALVVVLVSILVAGTAVAAKRTYTASLKGSHEVPANDSKAAGEAIVRISKDRSAVYYKLIVANIDGVVAAHIHCAPDGVNGPVGVPLHESSPIDPNGILAEDTITSVGANACGLADVGDLVELIESGNAYVNVHTTTFPPGEIRGQLD